MHKLKFLLLLSMLSKFTEVNYVGFQRKFQWTAFWIKLDFKLVGRSISRKWVNCPGFERNFQWIAFWMKPDYRVLARSNYKGNSRAHLVFHTVLRSSLLPSKTQFKTHSFWEWKRSTHGLFNAGSYTDQQVIFILCSFFFFSFRFYPFRRQI